MSFYKFFMDGVEVSEPMDWNELSITFTESSVFPGIVFSQAIPMSFVDDGYSTLLSAFESAVCNSIELKIQTNESGVYVDIYNGVIFLNSVVFDYHKGIADAEVKDNSFLAKIENNKDIKFKIDVARSKNDDTITPVTARDVNFFTPSTGVYDWLSIDCYDCGETLRYLVQAMTDGEVTAETTYLDSLGLVFCTGAAIGTPFGNSFAPTLSFKDAFEELYKKLNLTFIIEQPLGETPIIKIEPLGDIFVTTTNETIDGVLNVTGEADKDKYYQKVIIGSNTVIEDASGYTFPNPTFLGTREEEYHLLGVCNSSDSLELVSQFIIDSNVIEDIIVNGVTTYDNDIFIVGTDRPGTNQATRYSDIVSYYYNGILSNEQTAQRYLGAIPNSIANFLGNGDDGFVATKNTDETINVVTGGAYYSLEPVEYATEVSDPNANYDNATYYYLVPSSGSYAFFASVRYYVEGLVRSGLGVSEQVNVKIEVVRYTDNTFASEIESIESIVNYSLDNVTTQANVSATMYLNTNEAVRVRVSGQKVLAFDVSGATVDLVLIDSASSPTGSEPTFRCVATANGGGIYQTYEESDVRRVLYTVSQYPLTATKFKSIVNNIGQRLGISGTIEKSGWIKELVWNPFTSLADIVIRSLD